MKWITREKVKVDRVACPWLIRKFVDSDAEFIFVPGEQVMSEAERLGKSISVLARADGVDKIMLPGERGDAIRAEREASGIPIPKGTWQRIAKAAQAAGVTPPM